jgi:hypothetical protein
MNRFGLLRTLPFILALMLLTGSVVCAVELSAVESIGRTTIDIQVTGNARVHFTAGQGPNIEVSAQGSGDTHFSFASTAGTVFEIAIEGNGEADIEVSGPSELNITVEGPSEVHITAGDEVTVNVQADEESQVFLNEQINHLQAENQDQEMPDLDEPEEKAIIEDNQAQLAPEEVDDVKTSNPNSKIMAGAIPALAIAAFFFSRKKYKS